MNAKFYPSSLSGSTESQAYKPLAMRYFILAHFAKGQTKIYLKNESDDLLALKDALGDLGSSVTRESSVYTVLPPQQKQGASTSADVRASLGAFRLLLPMLSACFERVELTGAGKLTRKDLTPGLNLLKGVTLSSKSLPMEASGKLEFGEFIIEKDVNSQTVCALMMALPLLDGDSNIIFREKPKRQLRSVLEITERAMSEFGVKINKTLSGYSVTGGQEYVAPTQILRVEGDYSTAGYFLGANLIGSNVSVQNLNPNSLQTDKDVLGYLDALSSGKEVKLKGKTDYIFYLTALSACMDKKTLFTGVKIKDKDQEKFSGFCSTLERQGAKLDFDGQTLTVIGKAKLSGGVMLDSYGDYRIAMSLIIISTVMLEPVTILSVEAGMAEQSSFVNEFIRLGGKCEVA